MIIYNLFEYYKEDFLFHKNKIINPNVVLDKVNENPFFDYNKNDSNDDDIQNIDKMYFVTSLKNNMYNLNTNKETNLTDLNTNKSKPKAKLFFEIKKEDIPKFFTENSINSIIKHFGIINLINYF